MATSAREETAEAYEKLLEKFKLWAETQDGIRSAIVIGSRARIDHPADEFSDLDLSVFVENPQVYLDSTEWLDEIGHPCLSFVERTGDGKHWERRCLFEGGLDVDFAFVPSSLVIEMLEEGISPEVGEVFRRGFRILFDKDQLFEQLTFEISPQTPGNNVNEQAYLDVVNDFWYHAVWTAKHLRRGELWWAKECCDSHLKGLLRRMLEWHTQATSGYNKDTWMRGRFLEEWADPRLVQALKTVFACYELDDVWRALFETMVLFEWVTIEIKNALQLSYPETGILHSRAYVRQLYQQRTESKKLAG